MSGYVLIEIDGTRSTLPNGQLSTLQTAVGCHIQILPISPVEWVNAVPDLAQDQYIPFCSETGVLDGLARNQVFRGCVGPVVLAPVSEEC